MSFGMAQNSLKTAKLGPQRIMVYGKKFLGKLATSIRGIVHCVLFLRRRRFEI